MIPLFILVFIAGMAKAVMDTLQFHFVDSVFLNRNQKYWNPLRSWKEKYSDAECTLRKKWFGFIPVPVMLTDGWHLFQSIFLTSIFAAIVIYANITPYMIIDFVILRSVFGLAFILFYDKLLLK